MEKEQEMFYFNDALNTFHLWLYAPSHRQDSTYHGLCYTSRGALAGTRNYVKDIFLKSNKYLLTCKERDVAPW